MAVFSDNSDDLQRLDWNLLRNCSVRLLDLYYDGEND